MKYIDESESEQVSVDNCVKRVICDWQGSPYTVCGHMGLNCYGVP